MMPPKRKFDMSRSRPKPLLPDELGFVVMPKYVNKKNTKSKDSKWTLMPFVAVVLVLTLLVQMSVYLSRARNAKGEILGAATSAYADLSGAGSALTGKNFAAAQIKFSYALTSLQSAQSKLDEFKALQLIAPQAKSADHVITGAGQLAEAGKKLTEAMAIFDELKVSSKGVETSNVVNKLAKNRDLLSASLSLLKQARSEFDAVSNLPQNYNESLSKAKDQAGLLTGMLENLINLEDIYIGFFGTGPRVYLLVFENYDEVRATGGFIGTYGVIKINDGKIQDLKINSIYDLDGHIYDNIAAPGPFQPDIKKWGIRDANWFVDFPTSARKLMQFFESGSQTADGVIALTPAMFEDLLKLTGPIEMKNYNVTLDSENFQDVVQYKTSVDYNRKINQPKQMLADFAPLLLDRLSGLDKEKWIELLQIMQKNLNQKQALLYTKNPTLENKIEQLRVAGNILPSDQDYLNVVNTNLGGTKTDLEIKQKVNLSSKILSDGTVIDTLKIERTNTSAQINKDYMRVLVPMGSSLVSSSGFDQGSFLTSTAQGYTTDPDLAKWDQGQAVGRTFVRTEAGKTEFAGWTQLAGGESKTITLVYAIPHKVNIGVVNNTAIYSLLFQKQNGVRPYEFTATLDSGNLKPHWLTSDMAAESQTIKLNYTTGSDQYWAVLLGN